MNKIITRIALSIVSSFVCLCANATIVRIETNLGYFDVNLYDETTPVTVENFLSYVSQQAYDGTVIHRSIKDFIFQGGGYTYSYVGEDGAPTDYPNFEAIEQSDAILNEPKWSNLRGTISMARCACDPNSATSQWFINLSDKNAENLDRQNEGFTVFGEVIGVQVDAEQNLHNGFDTLDAIEDTPVYKYSVY